MDKYTQILGELSDAGIRFLVIGVGGANYYATRKHVLFNTEDCDLFLPPDARNLLACWQTLEKLGLELTANGEPLEKPLDSWLAERVVEHRAAVRASGDGDLRLDLTLVMRGATFEEIWPRRRLFEVEGHRIPVAPLTRIVESKREVARDKDALFFVTHEEILRELLEEEEGDQVRASDRGS